jgi:hypothetical protein
LKTPDEPIVTTATVDRDGLQTSLARLDRLARLMDEQFRLPVLGWRVGLDPILGVIPGGGDWASWLVGVYIFWEALSLDVPRPILTRMAANLAADLIAGYVPAAGDVFDAVFKANRKNVDLVLEHYGVTRRDGEPRLPVDLPASAQDALARNTSTGSKIVRYLLGFLVVLALFGLAALPFVLLWWWLNPGS